MAAAPAPSNSADAILAALGLNLGELAPAADSARLAQLASSGLLPLRSCRGSALLAELQPIPSVQLTSTSNLSSNSSTSEKGVVVAAMLPQFVKQRGRTFCGLASAAMVLRTLAPTSEHAEMDEESLLAHPRTREILDERAVRAGGMTLAQCSDILRAHQCAVQTFHAEESSNDKFASAVAATLAAGGAVIVNYHMSELGQHPDYSGHLSPLAAHCGDRMLLMDVWPETEASWVSSCRLFEAMCSVDSASGRSRGFLLVRADGN
eukprot:m.15520 g.15520  ORF g.15520 m.15520 type:complete len:264 (-) comp3442_c1_seq1:184-975(-)